MSNSLRLLMIARSHSQDAYVWGNGIMLRVDYTHKLRGRLMRGHTWERARTVKGLYRQLGY